MGEKRISEATNGIGDGNATLPTRMTSCVFMLACWCSALVLCHAWMQNNPRVGALLGGDDQQPSAQQLLRWGVLLATRNSEDSGQDADDASSEELEVSKRRKGPTLSVVSPLEVLRQRLRLDRAKERIRENQKQIVANEELLEKIGKRSMNLLLTSPNKP